MKEQDTEIWILSIGFDNEIASRKLLGLRGPSSEWTFLLFFPFRSNLHCIPLPLSASASTAPARFFTTVFHRHSIVDLTSWPSLLTSPGLLVHLCNQAVFTQNVL